MSSEQTHKHHPLRPRRGLRHSQQGAVAIEFAVLFLVFFAVLYAIIAYSIPLLLTLTFNHLSAEAAREAVKVDPSIGRVAYAQAVARVVNETIENSWLPENWTSAEACKPPSNTGLTWSPLESTPYAFLATETLGTAERTQLHVCLQRQYERDGDPRTDGAIIPVLPVFGGIPNLPKDESGQTFLRGRTTIRL